MSTVPDDLVVSRKSDINLSCQQMQICISLPILTLCRAAYILGQVALLMSARRGIASPQYQGFMHSSVSILGEAWSVVCTADD